MQQTVLQAFLRSKKGIEGLALANEFEKEYAFQKWMNVIYVTLKVSLYQKAIIKSNDMCNKLYQFQCLEQDISDMCEKYQIEINHKCAFEIMQALLSAYALKGVDIEPVKQKFESLKSKYPMISYNDNNILSLRSVLFPCIPFLLRYIFTFERQYLQKQLQNKKNIELIVGKGTLSKIHNVIPKNPETVITEINSDNRWNPIQCEYIQEKGRMNLKNVKEWLKKYPESPFFTDFRPKKRTIMKL